MTDPKPQPHTLVDTDDITGPNQGLNDATSPTAGAETELNANQLLQKLEAAEAKAQEHLDKLMRTLAETDNLRKRHDRELEKAHSYALERFANELLQVWDSLELGQQATMQEGADVVKLREGTELTLKLLVGTMEKFGITQVNPEGAPFNPEFHQAMAMQPREGAAPNSVVQVVQKGYLLNGRLLRPAMVIVAPN
jgi:molecular chaperone GrpE